MRETAMSKGLEMLYGGTEGKQEMLKYAAIDAAITMKIYEMHKPKRKWYEFWRWSLFSRKRNVTRRVKHYEENCPYKVESLLSKGDK